MKTISISAEKRTELGKKSTRDLRKANHVPCVMYGGTEVIHFHAHENDFRHLVYTHIAYIVEIKINGDVYKAVMKELQFHPVTRDDIGMFCNPCHSSFLRLCSMADSA